jgi:deoxyadenosine/deoxycytidine kinase
MVPEPVDQWQNVNGQGGNMLQQFYDNPQRYAYTFQNYVFITRVMQVGRLDIAALDPVRAVPF